MTSSSLRVDDESDEDASEAQAQVIGSLRAQVTDLFSQVTQLNSKLVASYDRVSDLEDQLHDASSSLRNTSVTISALELERSHHLAALNTGLLVEKAHVTTELNRLMERATEEAAQRGQAESARRDIEKDLDDLSASLFDQANTMVAEARLGKAKSEQKVQQAEQALKIAEDAVKYMQVKMQSLQAAMETAERDAQEARHTMGKGKWVERDELHVGDVPRIRFMTTHTPYAEFIAFISYLRGLRMSQPTPPVISTLLNQPFIVRLLTEDSEPTVRLDLAPSLNWLSRRSVLTAILAGMLTVEPWPFSSLLLELQQHPQSQSSSTLSCALCGTFIARLSSTTPVSRSHSTNGSSWFKYSLALGSTQNHNSGAPSAEREPPGQVYIFRLAPATAATPPPTLAPTHAFSASIPAVGTSSRPPLNAISSSRVLASQTQNSPHPLCTSNYCLSRLRSTCSLWAFVRVGIVERVWEEEVVEPPKPHLNGDTRERPSPPTSANTGSQPAGMVHSSASEKPPVPPRRRRLWEMASALGERAVSWGKESGENAKEKEKENDGAKKLYPPPPSHPSVPHPHAESPTSQANDVILPPLPKRNVVRARPTTDTVIPPSAPNGTSAPEAKESVAHENCHIDADTAEPNASNSSSTPVEEVTFTAPTSLSPPMTSHPIPTEPNTSPIEDHSPPSPHNIPLPMTPTPSNPISRVASPVPRSRSRLSSPASPPLGSRPASPAVTRSRAGSPTPTGIVRPTPPAPGHPPSVSHMRGKSSVSSPLASARPASPAPAPPGAPPLPRRAAARRAVPPPPVPGGPRAARETDKEEGAVPPSLASDDPNPEAHVLKSDEVEVSGETKISSDGQGGIESEAVATAEEVAVSQMASEPAHMEVAPEPVHDVVVEDAVRGLSANGNGNALSDPFPPAAPASEGGVRTSMDTTGTKLSSSTEGEGFASDATWEDRTWKTLLTLKEDMFWARIGGVRAQES